MNDEIDVFVTKYALTRGVYKIRARRVPNSDSVYYSSSAGNVFLTAEEFAAEDEKAKGQIEKKIATRVIHYKRALAEAERMDAAAIVACAGVSKMGVLEIYIAEKTEA